MNDNLDQKLDALFAAARATAPNTERAEFAFETRLAARLHAENSGSLFAWAWRLCPFFAALALAVGWWSHTAQHEEVVVAPLIAESSPATDEQLLVAYMTGDRR
jgi:hypothetical protein